MSTNPAGTNPMSSSTNPFTTQPPPEHHIHHSSDVLPGARGAQAAAPNYNTDVTNNAGTWQSESHQQRLRNDDTTAVMAGGQHSAGITQPDHEGQRGMEGERDAFSEERPMDVRPTGSGGVAPGGRSDLPEGHAGMGDKLAGKTQKVLGKMLKKPEMHEKGELREAGGKEAAAGRARAPHD